jgi:hypothetical protein
LKHPSEPSCWLEAVYLIRAWATFLVVVGKPLHRVLLSAPIPLELTNEQFTSKSKTDSSEIDTAKRPLKI